MSFITEVTTVGHSMRRYFQVMTTLFRTEAVRRIQHPREAVLSVLEPVFLIASIGLIYWLTDRHKSGVSGSPALFYASGLYAKYYFVNLGQVMEKSARIRRFPVEQWLDHIFIQAVLKFVDYLILGVFLVLAMLPVIGPQAIPYDFVPIFQAMGLLTMLGFGWGVLVVALKQGLGVPGIVFNTINRILILLSGALFVIDFMPPDVRYWLCLNPATHAIILFRQGVYPNYPSLSLDMPYLITWSISAVVVGFVLERAMRRQIENK